MSWEVNIFEMLFLQKKLLQFMDRGSFRFLLIKLRWIEAMKIWFSWDVLWLNGTIFSVCISSELWLTFRFVFSCCFHFDFSRFNDNLYDIFLWTIVPQAIILNTLIGRGWPRKTRSEHIVSVSKYLWRGLGDTENLMYSLCYQTAPIFLQSISNSKHFFF